MFNARSLAIALSAVVGLTTAAQAQLDPAVFTAGTETGSRYNVNSSATYGPNSVMYTDCYVYASGGSHLRLNQINLGIRRVGSTTALAPDVGLEITVVEMTWNGTTYGLGATVATETRQLAASESAYTENVVLNWPDVATRPVVNLQTTTQGLNGYGGFWVGVRFTGPNAANGNNGWRIVNEPTAGRAINNFGIYNANTSTFTPTFWFGQTTDSSAVVHDNPARFMASAYGVVTDSVAAPADQIYGRLFEHTTYWRPTDAGDGVGSKTWYNNCFVPAAAGDVFTPNKVVVGIYRGGSTTTPAPAVGVQMSLVQMNWDGAAYTPGTVVATETFQLASTTSFGTERVTWNFPNPATRPQVPLNTGNATNAGLGGYFVAARLIGDPLTLAGNNGPRICYAPAIGASWLGFGMYDALDVFVPNYVFGTYYSGSTTAPNGPYKPARFLTESFGTIGPAVPPPPSCPADLNHDSAVNASDLSTLLGSWGGAGGDVNGDGSTDAADLAAMLGAWGACP